MTTTPRIEITVPVYNEEHVLAGSIERLHAYLTEQFPFDWTIVIVDNASTDRTFEVAGALAHRLGHVEVIHLDEKGRGRALLGDQVACECELLFVVVDA